MLDRFRAHLAETGLVPDGARVLVGYSGGADSTCLLHLCARAGLDVVAGHLHHGQRAEAEKEMALCEAFATELGVPFLNGRADVPRMAQDLRIGLEEAGRKARYAFFAQAAYQLRCSLVATAHTRDDQAETILLNLTRGSGLSGLAGIPEQRENIIRPLLPFSRQETQAYCREHGLWTHDDPANFDLSFSRARIRHEVLPELRQINPAVDAAIARMAETVAEEDAFLNGMAAAALEQSEDPLNGDLQFLTEDVEVAFRRDVLTSLPAVLVKRAIRLAAEALGGELSHPQTMAIVEGLVGTSKGSVTTEGGAVAVEWDERRLHVRQLQPVLPFRYNLTLPGETISDEFGWQFTAWTEPFDGEMPVRADQETVFDARRANGALYFRTAKEGDEMVPLGFDGHRKLADLLSEARLTQAARQRLPIVCDMLGPIWAPGVCLNARVAPNQETETAIRLRFESLKGVRRS